MLALARLALASLTLLPALAAAPAIACSVTGTYRVPTNLELTANADTILLGRAESEVPTKEKRGLGEVIIRPVALLKGPDLPSEVRLSGYLSDDPELVVASDSRDLFRSNPGALMGYCVRYIFERDMLLLLFLERDETGKLGLASYPFARSAEDVPSPDAPWVKAVRLYVEIAALPERERKRALIARRDALREQGSDPDAGLLADDIDRQLKRRRIAPYD